ncbi:MAG: glycoside hydrolase family 2, partial [Phycisphaerales bacterium]|nr:glycoside hydrolase family 2 [Phycisphaerales bacterium]
MASDPDIQRRKFLKHGLGSAAVAALALNRRNSPQEAGLVQLPNALLPKESVLALGWQLQDAGRISQSGAEISTESFSPHAWHSATVPGTILTTLVNNRVYPEPLYGQNNRPEKIPESLCRTDWWYRGVFPVPASYAARRIWLNFDGINYAAEVWVNGKNVGGIEGAFIRGRFDVTLLVVPGSDAVIAVRVSPQPHPGVPYEHTLGAASFNGGVSALDGPTFVCAIGWDWIPGIRDRDTGIWQRVFLSASGPVLVKNPQVTTHLPLPRTDSAELTICVAIENVTGYKQKGILKGSLGEISFEKPIHLSYGETQLVTLDSQAFPQLHLKNPRLWWPNGLGPQNLHLLHVSFEVDGRISDARNVSFGIRQITYDVPGTDSLALSVNGVRVFCKGGNWGMDEALKRIPRARLEAQIRMHQLANLTMIRNWGGQSTSDDFYDLCDRYGILVWDEFFQFNDWNPIYFDRYMNNCRDKVLRIRNHPCIAVWCGRNEAAPPKYLDEALRNLFTELDPDRWYQSSSGGGRGVNSGGPYDWQTPQNYYRFSELKNFNRRETFKTEIGAISVPTIESIQGMMPPEDCTAINDDWAEHDFNSGGGRKYPQIMARRYGKIANLADFVRKGQMMNYEGYRAMYEGRLGQLFHPVQGILTWMSHPAQPSFVWQLYHHDLEPNASLFAVKKACEPVHIQLNDSGGGTLQVINHLPRAILGARATAVVYNFNGTLAGRRRYSVAAAASAATSLGRLQLPAGLSHVYFVKLQLHDAAGTLLSDNFYWHASAGRVENLTDLDALPPAALTANAVRRD